MIRPDVLLVSPHVHKVVQVRDGIPSKSLGLAYVAAALEAAGASVQVLDGKGLGATAGELVERIVAAGPRLVGFTAMTHELRRAAELALGVKARAPQIVTMLGGAHANALPGPTLERFPQFDVTCQGEGEDAVVELARALASGRGAAGIAGLSFRDGAKVVVGAGRPAIADLDRVPFPAWHLFPWTPHFAVYTARGCPYRCNFCMRAMGSRYRARSPENVVAELEELVDRHRASSFTFEDETFMIDRARTFRLLDLMKARGFDRLRWMANLHAKTVDDELAERLRDAGCVSIGTGVESGNPAVLARAGKGLTVEGARAAVGTMKRAGLEVRAFFIFGHPHKTWSTAMDTVRLAAELNPAQASFGIMVPYPDTGVAEMAARGQGGYKLLSMDWADYDKYLGHALELEALPRPHLELLQSLAYVWLYVRNGRVADLARFAWKHRGAARALVKMARGWTARLAKRGATFFRLRAGGGLTVRAFVSVPVEGEAARALAAVSAELRALAPKARWVDARSMHLTLKFLGPVDDARVPELEAAIAGAVRGMRAFDASLAGLGAFPDTSRISVVWAGLGRGRENAGTLARAVEEAMAPLGFARETRPYRAHVTLARVKDRLPRAAEVALGQALEAGRARAIAGLYVDRVELVSSVTAPGGSVYEPVATVRLED